MEDCIFCKIARGEIPPEKLYEDDEVIAFKDINPLAPFHVLVIPKAHIESVDEINSENAHLIAKIFVVIQRIAEEFHLDNGYRVVTNTGDDSGQTVHHLHFHILGGKKLSVEMC